MCADARARGGNGKFATLKVERAQSLSSELLRSR